jgi:hypothetical protein
VTATSRRFPLAAAATVAAATACAATSGVTTLLSGLTGPQGLAFSAVDGKPVLYVAESDQIDSYPWSPGGISGAAAGLGRRGGRGLPAGPAGLTSRRG